VNDLTLGLLVTGIGFAGAAATYLAVKWRSMPNDRKAALTGFISTISIIVLAVLLRRQNQKPGESAPSTPAPTAGREHLVNHVETVLVREVEAVDAAAQKGEETGDYSTLDDLLNADAAERR
jgi:hypothetical protein